MTMQMPDPETVRAFIQAQAGIQRHAEHLTGKMRTDMVRFSSVMCDCPKRFDPMNSTQFFGCIVHTVWLADYWVSQGEAKQ